MNTKKLTTAVETYFADLRRIRASGGATDELSYYPPLTNLLNTVGGTLKPKVFCISQLAQQGAGHPDFGLYALHDRSRKANTARDSSRNTECWKLSPLVTTPG